MRNFEDKLSVVLKPGRLPVSEQERSIMSLNPQDSD